MNATLTISSRNVQLTLLSVVALAAAFGLLPADAAAFAPLLLMNTDAAPGAGGAATPSAGAGASPAVDTATPSAGGGSPAAGGASAPAPAASKQPPLSRGARAAEKAAAKLATAKAGKPNTPTSSDSQQAPGGGTPAAGTSTEPKPGEAGTADPKGAAADGEGKPKGDAAPASTATAPQDWPKEDREAFEKIPDEGKQLVLGIHKKMHAGFTHAMTQLAEQSKTHQEAITIGKQFQTDPKATIAEMAKRAGVEVFFERPTADNQPSEDVLNDPVKYAKWIRDEAVRAATQQIEQKNAKDAAEKAKADEVVSVQQASAQLQQEFAAAAQAHTDFAEHKPKVVAILQRAQGLLSTEEAYQLATYPAMVERVNEGEKAKRELATLKADLERKAKDATRLPAGGQAPGAANRDDKFLSPGARALRRVEAKRSTRSAAG